MSLFEATSNWNMMTTEAVKMFDKKKVVVYNLKNQK